MKADTLRHTLAAVTALQRRHPTWVVWRYRNGRWSATRAPARDEAPSPGGYLVWVYAGNPDELAERMEEADSND